VSRLCSRFQDLNWRALRNCDRSQDTHIQVIQRNTCYGKSPGRSKVHRCWPWLSRSTRAARACCCSQLGIPHLEEVIAPSARGSQNSAMSPALHQRVQLCSPLGQPRHLQSTQTFRYPCVLTPLAACGNRQGAFAAAVDVMNLLTHPLVPNVVMLATRRCTCCCMCNTGCGQLSSSSGSSRSQWPVSFRAAASRSSSPADDSPSAPHSVDENPVSSSQAAEVSGQPQQQQQADNSFLALPLLIASSLSHVNRQYIKMRRRRKWWSKMGGYPKVRSFVLAKPVQALLIQPPSTHTVVPAEAYSAAAPAHPIITHQAAQPTASK
jgi:hypothetical protein